MSFFSGDCVIKEVMKKNIEKNRRIENIFKERMKEIEEEYKEKRNELIKKYEGKQKDGDKIKCI